MYKGKVYFTEVSAKGEGHALTQPRGCGYLLARGGQGGGEGHGCCDQLPREPRLCIPYFTHRASYTGVMRHGSTVTADDRRLSHTTTYTSDLCVCVCVCLLLRTIDEGEGNERKDKSGRCPSKDDKGEEVRHITSARSSGDAPTIKAAVMVEINHTALTS